MQALIGHSVYVNARKILL